MPVSKRRKLRPPALKGIPESILRRAPKDWSPADKASFARAFMDGAAGRPYRRGDQKQIEILSPLARRKAIHKQHRTSKAGWLAGNAARRQGDVQVFQRA
jgi:hypothetical protein